MKTNSAFVKLFLLFTTLTFSTSLLKAQCNAPSLVWANPVLTNGTAGQLNAVYKFPSVAAGVDAYVTVTGITGGASLSDIDDVSLGYSDAWQPVVKTPTVMGASTSYVSFKVDFKNSSDNSPHTFSCLQLSCIDIDGDGQNIKEFVAAKNPNSTTVTSGTSLTLTSLAGGIVQATGPITNYPGIDTSAYNTNVNYRYTNISSISEVRFGNVTNSTFTVQDRYSCVYFKQITSGTGGNTVLAVKYASFTAFASNNIVTLNWVTEQEINNNHFEVQRSFDGISFSTIATVLDRFATGNEKNYMYKDDAPELKSENVAYYRLKQVDNDGKLSYSNTLVVKFQFGNSIVPVQISPNPFTENLNVSFASATTGNAIIDIMNTTGQKVITRPAIVNKGFNTLQLSGLAALTPGIYIVRLTIDGAPAGTQKVIKK